MRIAILKNGWWSLYEVLIGSIVIFSLHCLAVLLGIMRDLDSQKASNEVRV